MGKAAKQKSGGQSVGLRPGLWAEALEGRVLMHAGHDDAVYPVGTLVPWHDAPITAPGTVSPPVVPPTVPPVVPPVVPPTVPPTVPPVSPPAVGSVTGLTLIDAAADTDLGAFAAGSALNLGTTSYSVRANTSGEVGSVRFLLDGQPIRTETSAPFSVAGDANGDYTAWAVAAGGHTLSVVPFSGADGTGTAGQPVDVAFTVTGAPTVPPAGFTAVNYVQKAASPIARAEALMATSNDRLFVFGGFNNANGPVTTSHYYTPATNSWTEIEPLPQRITHAGVAQTDADVYFVGAYVGTAGQTGYGQTFGSTKVWKYNFASDAYAEITPLPRPLAGGGAAIVDGKLHYIGGYNLNRTDTNVHLVLDLNNQAAGWQTAAVIPQSRNHMGTAVVGGKIYVIAGQTGTDEGLVTQSTVQIYDPATDSWTPGRPMPKAASHITSATFVMGDRIIVMGGESAHNVQARDVFAYTPATDTWQTLTSLPAARFSGVANVINGKIYFTGGGSQTTTWEGTPG